MLGKIGGFGGLFAPNFAGMREPVLVSSIDGVGTKLKIAFAMDRHDTVGADLVNHCINDIAVLGARPLFFLDYIGAEKLEPRVFEQILRGFTKACRAGGCALIGGETAQMPGMYRRGEYDLAGCIVGVVDRARMIDGSRIKPGDVILGLPSNGLHTNGYSLAREDFLRANAPETIRADCRPAPVVRRRTPADAQELPATPRQGAAREVEGPRPHHRRRPDRQPAARFAEDCDAVIEIGSWKVPAIFQILQERGRVPRDEMYQVFNMGIGMAAIVSPNDAAAVGKQLRARVDRPNRARSRDCSALDATLRTARARALSEKAGTESTALAPSESRPSCGQAKLLLKLQENSSRRQPFESCE